MGDNAEESFKNGLDYYKKEDYQKSLKYFEYILEIDPNNSQALWGKGASLLKKNNYKLAIKSLNKALEIDNDLVGAWNDKGVCFSYLKNYSKEMQCYKNALKIDSDTTRVIVNMGLLLVKLKKYKKARNCFYKVLKQEPENFEALNGLGNSFLDSGKNEESLEYYDKAMNINLNFIYAPNNKGIALLGLKNYEEAITYFERALKINPKYAPSLYGKVRCLRNLNLNYKAQKIESKLNDPTIKEIFLEKNLEEKLANNLELLKPWGYDLKLISQQEGCMGGKGRMDLFCKDKNTFELIIIELKNVMATANTFNQIHNYLKSMKEVHKQPIKGLVISRDCNDEFNMLINNNNQISYLDLQNIGFE